MKIQSTGSVVGYLLLVFAVGLAIGVPSGYTLAKKSPARLPAAQKFEDGWLATYRSELNLTDEQVRAVQPLLAKPVEDLSGIWYRAIMTMGAVQERVDRRIEPLLDDAQREKLVVLIRKGREKRRYIAREKFSQQAGRPDSLWHAAAIGDAEAIRRHLRAGVDIDQRDLAFGMTSLGVAAVHGQAGAVDLLLREGADVNARLSDGNTALHGAAFFGRAEVVQTLLKNGADASARNEEGRTPLEGMAADWETIQFIAAVLQLELEPESVQAGREVVAGILGNMDGERPDATRDAENLE